MKQFKIILITFIIFIICSGSIYNLESNTEITSLEKNVFVISYGPFEDKLKILDWYNDSAKAISYSKSSMIFRTQKLIDYLRCGSTWHSDSYYDCHEDFLLDYKIHRMVYSDEIPPYGEDGNFDYAYVYKEFELCNLIKKDKIDEIWIWENGNGNASEWITSKSKNSTGNPLSNNMPPFCGKTTSVLNFNYTRSIDLALHTFGHRIEGAMLTHHPEDFSFGAEPMSFASRPSPDNDYVGNCGDIHRPPNVYTTHDLEYIYDSPAYAISTCDTWSSDDDSMRIKKIISCKDWGCHPGKYYIWWMQHIPEIWWRDLFK